MKLRMIMIKAKTVKLQ